MSDAKNLTPREPYRFDKQAREVTDAVIDCMNGHENHGECAGDGADHIAAALRAEHASALERAALSVQPAFPHIASQIRALVPPAAAPAAETRNAPHTTDCPATHHDPFREELCTCKPTQGADKIGYCKTCGLDASHGVCNDPRDALLLECEEAVREAVEDGSWAFRPLLEKLRARAAPPEREGK